jgi:hypothetical protein
MGRGWQKEFTRARLVVFGPNSVAVREFDDLPGGGGFLWLSASADGKWAVSAYVDTGVGRPRAGLSLIDLASGGRSELRAPPGAEGVVFGASLSPDGTALVVIAPIGSHPQVYAQRIQR